MQSVELITIGAVLIFSSALAYRSSFLHNKKIGYISLLQICYLVIAPGFLYTIIFSYLIEILERPKNNNIIFSDKLLVSLFLLSTLYTYGGIAIHGICKTLNTYFDKKQLHSMSYKVNNYFHRQFSHNLTFIGAITSATCLALLELNHISYYPKQSKLVIIALNGLFVGIASTLGLSFYKKRWLELKLFFFSLWALLILLAYSVKPYIKNVKAYPFTLTILIVFSILAGLNIFLYVKRVKNKVKIALRIPKHLLN